MSSSPLRMMICDDSATMRRLIKFAFQSETKIEIVAEAKNGREAVEQIEAVKPDILLMDVEMPEMDGIEAVYAIRKKNRCLPIIMFSSLTSRGAEATLDALSAGANDFATKPTAQNDFNKSVAYIQKELVTKINELVKPSLGLKPRQSLVSSVEKVQTKSDISNQQNRHEDFPPSNLTNFRPEIIAIGVSTGGPNTLATLFSKLIAPFPWPILVVQHMPAIFTNLLANRLSATSQHIVKEANEGEKIESGKVFLAPGDFHMTAKRIGSQFKINLNQAAPENSSRPAVDVLFRSVAEVSGSRALGIVLTGMGKDGLLGATAIKQRCGKIIAQDQQSSVVWGMPRHIAENGQADAVLSLEQIIDQLNCLAYPAKEKHLTL